MRKNYFARAERQRLVITKVQERKLTAMYKELAKDIEKEIASISQRTNVSSILRTQYLEGLAKQVKAELKNIGAQQKTSIINGMTAISKEVVASNSRLLSDMGITLTGTYSYIPKDVVTEVITGGLYKGRWNLNSAIWSGVKKTQKDIDYVIAQGIAAQKPTFEIAKDLEKYVNPAKLKGWEWAKVYPNTNKVVDYNAQRLARTMISHAYQDSFVRCTAKNPFIDEYEWIASGGDRMCEVCAERDGKHFKKTELPLDHPNGMCTFGIVMEKDLNAVGKELAEWVNGKQNREIDEFARSLGYPINTVKSSIKV